MITEVMGRGRGIMVVVMRGEVVMMRGAMVIRGEMMVIKGEVI